MAAPGQVTTARGDVINMDELKRNANKRPLTAEEKAAMKDEVKPRKRPKKAINVRGNMPSRGEAALDHQDRRGHAKMQEETAPVEEEKEFDKNPEGKSVADFTGIKVDKPTRLKGKVENPVEEADNTLNDIMGELEANTPHSRDAADVVDKEEADEKKTTRRTTKKG